MKNITKYGIFLVGIISLLTLNVSALSNPSNDSIKLENNEEEPISIDINIDFEPYNHEELRDYSDTIVVGTVKEILPPKWNTADGKQPNKAIAELNNENVIYTDIIVSVDEYLKNPLSSKEIIVRITGGTIGKISMSTDADPSFKMGEKVLIYLSKDDDPYTKDFGPEHFIVTDFYEGKFTLTDDGKAIGYVQNTTLNELLSTINQTDNKTNDTEMSDNTKTVSKQEGNSNSTPESKSAPFISSFWALAAVIGAVSYARKTK